MPFSELTEAEKAIVYDGPAEKKHILYRPKNGRGRQRARLHLLQRRAHGRKRAGQGQGRKGHEARGEVSPAGRLSGVRRQPAQRGGARAEAARHFAGRGLPDDAFRAGRLGRRRAGQPARADAPDGAEHLRFVSIGRAAADGSRAGLSGARPRVVDALDRRAPADAAGPRRAQPDDRRAVRARRAVHRPAPGEHRRADRRDARSRRRRQLRRAGRPRRPDSFRGRLDHRDGAGSRRGRRARDRAGHGRGAGKGPRVADRAVSQRGGRGRLRGRARRAGCSTRGESASRPARSTPCGRSRSTFQGGS